jgi:hypothetical protein
MGKQHPAERLFHTAVEVIREEAVSIEIINRKLPSPRGLTAGSRMRNQQIPMDPAIKSQDDK